MKPSLSCLPVAILVSLAAPSAAAPQSRVVDESVLRAPPADEWLTHGRDYEEQRYSPLDQIDTGNVGDLDLVWSLDLQGPSDARVESTPLVSNGIIYATGNWNTLFAVDARTGELVWSWDPAIVRGGRNGREMGGPSLCCGAVNRGVALYEGKVYVGLLDGRLVALDAQAGKPVWVVQTTPVGEDYSITGAPRVVKGRVIIGNGGAEFGVRGYVTAYDAETGEQVWRTYTVPGDPSLGFESEALEMAASTWHGEWWMVGGGGTVWDAMAFDADADLLYVGTGNGSPWSHQIRSQGQGDNLFLASILALDPDTGELVWHYQTTPGENWDYTAVQTITLADIVIDGEERQVLMQAPKNGFFYVLDRRTGELISAELISEHVTWTTGMDMATGRPIETPEARYDTVGSWIAPGARGVHNYDPMSFSPQTGLAYIPGNNTVGFRAYDPNFEIQPGRFNTGTARGQAQRPPRPPTPEPAGFLVAWDPATQQERWRIPYDTQRNGGTMATAGGLLFSGTEDGWMYAHDAGTGEVLWRWELWPGPASPVTYELDGRQYVTILTRTESPDLTARIWTFALPDN